MSSVLPRGAAGSNAKVCCKRRGGCWRRVEPQSGGCTAGTFVWHPSCSLLIMLSNGLVHSAVQDIIDCVMDSSYKRRRASGEIEMV
jgi:hypothetical protein